MIRNTMLALSLITLAATSAFAAPAAHRHGNKATVVAQAPAADSAKEPAKEGAKDTKKAKHTKKAKAEAPKTEAPADAPAKK